MEELQKLAKENGMELDAAQAEEMYARLHPITQELSDDELDNVTGGDSCDVGYNCEMQRNTGFLKPLWLRHATPCAVQPTGILLPPKHRIN